MELAWGVVLTLLSFLAWAGQVIYTLSPRWGARLQLGEAEADVDPVFFADARGEAAWDSVILWVLPVAGILLLQGSPLWPHFGLVGGGSYLYFSGRNIVTRRMLHKQGIRIGTARNIFTGYLFCTLWGIMALITIVMATVALMEF